MRTVKEKLFVCALIFLLLLLTGVTGCGSKSSDSSSPNSTPASEPAAPDEPVAPPQPPAPAANAADLLGTSLSFIPDGSQQPAAEVTVGQKGNFNSTIFNAGGTDANSVLVRFEVDGANSGESTIPVVAQGQEAQSPPVAYTFNEPGLRTVHLVVDPNGQVPETNDGNNGDLTTTVNVVAAGAGPGPGPVGPGGGVAARQADLLGGRLYFQPAGSQQPVLQTVVGQAGNLGATISNAGTAEAANATGHIEVDGINAGNVTFGVTPAGQESPPVLIPYTFNAARTYSLRLFVDTFPGETNVGNNNDSTASIEVIDAAVPPPPPPPGPANDLIDLTGTRLYFVPDNVGQPALQTTVGQPGMIGGAVFCVGNAAASNFAVRVTDNNGFAGESMVLSVQPGQEVSIPPIPYTFNTPGKHTLRLRVNPLNNPRETNTNNNSDRAIALDILPAPGPDAAADSIDLTGTRLYFIPDNNNNQPALQTTVGQSGTIGGAVTNSGSAIASSVLVQATDDGVYAGESTVPSAPPNQEVSIPSIPYTFRTEGTHTLQLKVNPLNSPTETNTDNNDDRTIDIDVRQADGGAGGNQQADLVISTFGYVSPGARDVGNTAKVGEAGVIRAVIENRSDRNVSADAYGIISHNKMQMKRQNIALGPNGTFNFDAPRKFMREGDYSFIVEVYPDGTQASRKTRTMRVHVEPAEPAHGRAVTHKVEGQIDLFKMGAITTSVTDEDTCFIRWSVGSKSREPSTGIDVSVYVDNDRKDHKTFDLGPNPASKTGLVYDVKFPADNRPHSILLAIDDDKRIKKDITVTHAETRHYDVTGTLLVMNSNGTMPIFYNNRDIYKLRYTIENHSRENVRDLFMQIKLNDTSKRERDVYMGPSPAKITQYIENFTFDRTGRNVIKMKLGEDFKCELPVEVISIEDDQHGYGIPTKAIKLYNSHEEETTTVAVNEKCKIKYTVGNNRPEPISNIKCKVTSDNEVKEEKEVDLAAGVRERSFWIDDVKFLTPGPHTIMLACTNRRFTPSLNAMSGNPDSEEVTTHTEKMINALDESRLATTQHTQTSSEGSGEKMLETKPDAKAVDIGFIPTGSKDYIDQVYLGTNGCIYGAFANNTQAVMRDITVQILVDGKVLRQSLRASLNPAEMATMKVDNYRFNTLGQHKVSLIVDPANKIKELDEKNNRVTHTVNVIRKTKPTTPVYDSNVGIMNIIDTFRKPKDKGPSSPPPYTPPTYTPPDKPKVTTTVVDQDTSLSDTSKKKTPVYTTKGLGK